jgi:hypothetical protein
MSWIRNTAKNPRKVEKLVRGMDPDPALTDPDPALVTKRILPFFHKCVQRTEIMLAVLRIWIWDPDKHSRSAKESLKTSGCRFPSL